jgi:hypothetical protein
MLLAMVSNIRHLRLHNPLLETKRHCLVISFEDLLCAFPTGGQCSPRLHKRPPDCWRNTANDWFTFESETQGSIIARRSQHNRFTSIPADRTNKQPGRRKRFIIFHNKRHLKGGKVILRLSTRRLAPLEEPPYYSTGFS